MLITSLRHTKRDIEAWRRFEDASRAHAQLSVYRKRVDRARQAVLSFASTPCYAGVSWGKDSVCLAHLVATQAPQVPLVWVRVEPDYNPDCLLVRDEFLRMFPRARYDEIVVERGQAPTKEHGSLERGMAVAAQRYGDRYLSGIRGEENRSRSRRMKAYGESTARTGAPIGWWSGWDVFAYLVTHGLPIHPAYACTMGGSLDPIWIRVSPLGGVRGARPGDGMGRAEWEQRYYGQELLQILAGKRKKQ
jgi:phosphoadenosine phosphosulfate reductase